MEDEKKLNPVAYPLPPYLPRCMPLDKQNTFKVPRMAVEYNQKNVLQRPPPRNPNVYYGAFKKRKT
jgi:hypothetical protein